MNDYTGYAGKPKLSSIHVRYELKTGFGWLRISGGYFKDLSLDKDNKLVGLKYSGYS